MASLSQLLPPGNVLTAGGAQTLTDKTITEMLSVISTNTTAVPSTVYVITASCTLTLPASPVRWHMGAREQHERHCHHYSGQHLKNNGHVAWPGPHRQRLRKHQLSRGVDQLNDCHSLRQRLGDASGDWLPGC